MHPEADDIGLPRFRALELTFVGFTTLTLICVFGLLALDLFWSGRPGVAAPNGPQVALAGAKARPLENARPQQPVAHDEAQEAHAPRIAALNRVQTPAPEEPRFFARQAIVNAAIILVMAFVTAMIFALCVMALLRRHTRKFGALFRIDHVNTQPASTAYWAAPVHDGGHRRDAERVHSNSPAAQAFDLGDSFETERQKMDVQAQRLHSAVLQQLCEENLKLQAEIGMQRSERQQSPRQS